MKRDTIDVEEAAKLLGCTAGAVYWLHQRRSLRGYYGRGRRRVRFRREDVVALRLAREQREARLAECRVAHEREAAARELVRQVRTGAPASSHPLAHQVAELLGAVPAGERAAVLVEALRVARERAAVEALQ